MCVCMYVFKCATCYMSLAPSRTWCCVHEYVCMNMCVYVVVYVCISSEYVCISSV
jgi:hypothetical protein